MYTPKTDKKMKGDTLPKTHDLWGITVLILGGIDVIVFFHFSGSSCCNVWVLMETKPLVVELLVLVLVLLVDVVEVLVTPLAGNQRNHGGTFAEN